MSCERNFATHCAIVARDARVAARLGGGNAGVAARVLADTYAVMMAQTARADAPTTPAIDAACRAYFATYAQTPRADGTPLPPPIHTATGLPRNPAARHGYAAVGATIRAAQDGAALPDVAAQLVQAAQQLSRASGNRVHSAAAPSHVMAPGDYAGDPAVAHGLAALQARFPAAHPSRAHPDPIQRRAAVRDTNSIAIAVACMLTDRDPIVAAVASARVESLYRDGASEAETRGTPIGDPLPPVSVATRDAWCQSADADERLAGVQQHDRTDLAAFAQDPDARIRAHVAVWTDSAPIAQALTRDPVPDVRRALAYGGHHPATYAVLASDNDARVRQIVADRTDDAHIQQQLATDSDVGVRLRVAQRTVTPAILATLANDADADVAATAVQLAAIRARAANHPTPEAR